jgi:glycosyltransferase involved in cell wall biosynthesis
MRIAITHDYLNQYGGAERVLDALHGLYPTAPIYTSIYDSARMPASYNRRDIRTSFMQRLPGVAAHHQAYLPLYPIAFESFDLADYDVVLSNSSAWCKGVLVRPDAMHICYCLTPMRWAWRYQDYVERERLGRLARAGLPAAMTALRIWDVTSSLRVDHFLAISREVAARIKKYYQRPSTVIYPPVETSRFQNDQPAGDYYLVVSRLIPYKRVDLAVEAFNRLGMRLKIVGEGRDRTELASRARPNIEFLGRISDSEVVKLVQGCRAFVFPGQEDFGIAPVEAQAAGRPVVAFGAGGALDTVIDGETGVHFTQQTPEALEAAVRKLEALPIDSRRTAEHARKFDSSVFRRELAAFVDGVANEGRPVAGPVR